MKKAKSLPKSFERKWSATPYLHNDRFITNGHFLVPRFLVKEDYKYCPPLEVAKRDDIDRVVPSEETARFVYVKTNRLFDYGDFYVREFECKEHFSEEARKAYLNEDYVKFFEIEKINGSNQLNPFVCLLTNVVIMPCRDPQTMKEGKK